MIKEFGLAVLAAMSSIGLTSALAEPHEAMSRLEPLAGDYKISGVRHTPDGPVQLKQTEMSGAFILKGHVFSETRTSDLGLEEFVTLQTQISYDQYRNVYRVAVVDDNWGLMDIYEGNFTSDAILEVTNLRSDTHFPLEGGSKLHFKLQWDIGGDKKVFKVFLSSDAGESWSPYFEEVLSSMN